MKEDDEKCKTSHLPTRTANTFLNYMYSQRVVCSTALACYLLTHRRPQNNNKDKTKQQKPSKSDSRFTFLIHISVLTQSGNTAMTLNQYCSVTFGRPVVISISLVVSQKQTINSGYL